jgi:hypothetical protein
MLIFFIRIDKVLATKDKQPATATDWPSWGGDCCCGGMQGGGVCARLRAALAVTTSSRPPARASSLRGKIAMFRAASKPFVTLGASPRLATLSHFDIPVDQFHFQCSSSAESWTSSGLIIVPHRLILENRLGRCRGTFCERTAANYLH